MNQSKRTTTYEKTLMVILIFLIVISCYYLFFYKPSMERLTSLDAEADDISTNINLAQAQLVKKEKMQSEIDAIFRESNGNPTAISVYDNTQNILHELNDIFGMTAFDLTFATPQMADDIVRRNISLSFNVSSYAEVESILRKLHDSEYRCLIRDMSIRFGSSSSGATYTVSAEITYFEYYESKVS